MRSGSSVLKLYEGRGLGFAALYAEVRQISSTEGFGVRVLKHCGVGVLDFYLVLNHCEIRV